jgi:SAM-dependent methyltransferase
MMDVWAAGDLYKPYVGRWSRRVARDFLAWLAVPAEREWADVGCGTGALTQSILEHAAPRKVRGIDPSPGFIEYARARTPDARASFAVGDARNLPLEPESCDAAVAGLVLNFVPTPAVAVAQMARAVRPGGIVAAYVWDYAGKMQLMRYFWDAAVSLDANALALDEGLRFPMCAPGALAELFGEAELPHVQVRAIDIPTRFRDFDDYWTPFLGNSGPAPSYAASLEQGHRELLRARLEQRLPRDASGHIRLRARAFAVRGVSNG